MKKRTIGELLIQERLLDVESRFYTQPYAFELCDKIEPKAVKECNHEEFIVAKISGKNHVFKRIYG